MGQVITIEQLQSIAEKRRKQVRSEGGFPERRRMMPRSAEKEEALFLLRLNASVKYGLKRFPDGTYRLQQRETVETAIDNQHCVRTAT
jgi:hypothetical protein